jgi:hypothetical protein
MLLAVSIYLTTSDGQLHKYAGSHSLAWFVDFVRSGGENGWVRVINASSRTGLVQISQIVTIAEADYSITAPDVFYTPD